MENEQTNKYFNATDNTKEPQDTTEINIVPTQETVGNSFLQDLSARQNAQTEADYVLNGGIIQQADKTKEELKQDYLHKQALVNAQAALKAGKELTDADKNTLVRGEWEEAQKQASSAYNYDASNGLLAGKKLAQDLDLYSNSDALGGFFKREESSNYLQHGIEDRVYQKLLADNKDSTFEELAQKAFNTGNKDLYARVVGNPDSETNGWEKRLEDRKEFLNTVSNAINLQNINEEERGYIRAGVDLGLTAVASVVEGGTGLIAMAADAVFGTAVTAITGKAPPIYFTDLAHDLGDVIKNMRSDKTILDEMRSQNKVTSGQYGIALASDILREKYGATTATMYSMLQNTKNSVMNGFLDSPYAALNTAADFIPAFLTLGSFAGKIGTTVTRQLINKEVNSLIRTGLLKKGKGLTEQGMVNMILRSPKGARLQKWVTGSALVALSAGDDANSAAKEVRDQINGMSFEDLEQFSDDYKMLLQQGYSPEDARALVAMQAGNQALLSTLPGSIAANAIGAGAFNAVFGSVGKYGTSAVKGTARKANFSGEGGFTKWAGKATGDIAVNMLSGAGEGLSIGYGVHSGYTSVIDRDENMRGGMSLTNQMGKSGGDGLYSMVVGMSPQAVSSAARLTYHTGVPAAKVAAGLALAGYGGYSKAKQYVKDNIPIIGNNAREQSRKDHATDNLQNLGKKDSGQSLNRTTVLTADAYFKEDSPELVESIVNDTKHVDPKTGLALAKEERNEAMRKQRTEYTERVNKLNKQLNPTQLRKEREAGGSMEHVDLTPAYQENAVQQNFVAALGLNPNNLSEATNSSTGATQATHPLIAETLFNKDSSGKYSFKSINELFSKENMLKLSKRLDALTAKGEALTVEEMQTITNFLSMMGSDGVGHTLTTDALTKAIQESEATPQDIQDLIRGAAVRDVGKEYGISEKAAALKAKLDTAIAEATHKAETKQMELDGKSAKANVDNAKDTSFKYRTGKTEDGVPIPQALAEQIKLTNPNKSDADIQAEVKGLVDKADIDTTQAERDVSTAKQMPENTLQEQQDKAKAVTDAQNTLYKLRGERDQARATITGLLNDRAFALNKAEVAKDLNKFTEDGTGNVLFSRMLANRTSQETEAFINSESFDKATTTNINSVKADLYGRFSQLATSLGRPDLITQDLSNKDTIAKDTALSKEDKQAFIDIIDANETLDGNLCARSIEKTHSDITQYSSEEFKSVHENRGIISKILFKAKEWSVKTQNELLSRFSAANGWRNIQREKIALLKSLIDKSQNSLGREEGQYGDTENGKGKTLYVEYNNIDGAKKLLQAMEKDLHIIETYISESMEMVKKSYNKFGLSSQQRNQFTEDMRAQIDGVNSLPSYTSGDLKKVLGTVVLETAAGIGDKLLGRAKTQDKHITDVPTSEFNGYVKEIPMLLQNGRNNNKTGMSSAIPFSEASKLPTGAYFVEIKSTEDISSLVHVDGELLGSTFLLKSATEAQIARVMAQLGNDYKAFTATNGHTMFVPVSMVTPAVRAFKEAAKNGVQIASSTNSADTAANILEAENQAKKDKEASDKKESKSEKSSKDKPRNAFKNKRVQEAARAGKEQREKQEKQQAAEEKTPTEVNMGVVEQALNIKGSDGTSALAQDLFTWFKTEDISQMLGKVLTPRLQNFTKEMVEYINNSGIKHLTPEMVEHIKKSFIEFYNDTSNHKIDEADIASSTIKTTNEALFNLNQNTNNSHVQNMFEKMFNALKNTDGLGEHLKQIIDSSVFKNKEVQDFLGLVTNSAFQSMVAPIFENIEAILKTTATDKEKHDLIVKELTTLSTNLKAQMEAHETFNLRKQNAKAQQRKNTSGGGRHNKQKLSSQEKSNVTDTLQTAEEIIEGLERDDQDKHKAILKASLQGLFKKFAATINEMSDTDKQALYEEIAHQIGALNTKDIRKADLDAFASALESHLDSKQKEFFVADDEAIMDTVEDAFKDEGITLDSGTKGKFLQKAKDFKNRIVGAKNSEFAKAVKDTIKELGTKQALKDNMKDLIEGINLWAGDSIINSSWLNDDYGENADEKEITKSREKSRKLSQFLRKSMIDNNRLRTTLGESISETDQAILDKVQDLIEDPIKFELLQQYLKRNKIPESSLHSQQDVLDVMDSFFAESGLMLNIIEKYKNHLEKSGYSNMTLKQFADDIRKGKDVAKFKTWADMLNSTHLSMNFNNKFRFEGREYSSLQHAIYANRTGKFVQADYDSFQNRTKQILETADLFKAKNVTVQVPQDLDELSKEELEKLGVTVDYVDYSKVSLLNNPELGAIYRHALASTELAALDKAMEKRVLQIIASSMNKSAFVMMTDNMDSKEASVLRAAMNYARKDVYQYNESKGMWYTQKGNESTLSSTKEVPIDKTSVAVYMGETSAKNASQARSTALGDMFNSIQAHEVGTTVGVAHRAIQAYSQAHPTDVDFTNFSHIDFKPSNNAADNVMAQGLADVFGSLQDSAIRQKYNDNHRSYEADLLKVAKFSPEKMQRHLEKILGTENVNQEGINNNQDAILKLIEDNIESIIAGNPDLATLLNKSDMSAPSFAQNTELGKALVSAAYEKPISAGFSLRDADMSVHQDNFNMLQNTTTTVDGVPTPLITKVSSDGKTAYALIEKDNKGGIKKVHVLGKGNNIEQSIDTLVNDPVVNIAYRKSIKEAIDGMSNSSRVSPHGDYTYNPNEDSLAAVTAGVSNGIIKRVWLPKSITELPAHIYDALKAINEAYAAKDAEGNILRDVINLTSVNRLQEPKRGKLIEVPEGTPDSKIPNYLSSKFPGVPKDVLLEAYNNGSLYENSVFVLQKDVQLDHLFSAANQPHIRFVSASEIMKMLRAGEFDQQGNLVTTNIYVLNKEKNTITSTDSFKYPVYLVDPQGASHIEVKEAGQYFETEDVSAETIRERFFDMRIKNLDGSTENEVTPFSRLEIDGETPAIVQVGSENLAKWTEALRYDYANQRVVADVRTDITKVLANTEIPREQLSATVNSILEMVSPEGQFAKIYDTLSENFESIIKNADITQNLLYLSENPNVSSKYGPSALSLLTGKTNKSTEVIPRGTMGAMALATLSVFSTVGAGIGRMQSMDALKKQLGLENTSISVATLAEHVGTGMLQSTSASLLTTAVYNVLGVKPNLKDMTINTQKLFTEGVGIEIIAALTKAGLLDITKPKDFDGEGGLFTVPSMVRLGAGVPVTKVSLERTSPMFKYLEGLSSNLSRANWRAIPKDKFKPNPKYNAAENALYSAEYTMDLDILKMLEELGMLDVEALGGTRESTVEKSLPFYQAQMEAKNDNIYKQINTLKEMYKALRLPDGSIDPNMRIHFNQKMIESIKRITSGNAESPQGMKLLRSVLNFGTKEYKIRDGRGKISNQVLNAQIAILLATGHKTEYNLSEDGGTYEKGITDAYAALNDPNSAWAKAVAVLRDNRGDWLNLTKADKDIVSEAIRTTGNVDAIERPYLLSALKFQAEFEHALADPNTKAFNTDFMVYVDGVAHGPSMFMQKFQQDQNNPNTVTRVMKGPKGSTPVGKRDKDLYNQAVDEEKINAVLNSPENSAQDVAQAKFALKLLGYQQDGELIGEDKDKKTGNPIVKFTRDFGKRTTTVNGAYNGGVSALINHVTDAAQDVQIELANAVYQALTDATSFTDYEAHMNNIVAYQKYMLTDILGKLSPVFSLISPADIATISDKLDAVMKASEVTKDDITSIIKEVHEAYKKATSNSAKFTKHQLKTIQANKKLLEKAYDSNFDKTALGLLTRLASKDLGDNPEKLIKATRNGIEKDVLVSNGVSQTVNQTFRLPIVSKMWNTALDEVLGDQRRESALITAWTQDKAVEIQNSLIKHLDGKDINSLTEREFRQALLEVLTKTQSFIPTEAELNELLNSEGYLNEDAVIPIVGDETVSSHLVDGKNHKSVVESSAREGATSIASIGHVTQRVINIGVGAVAKYIISKEAETMAKTVVALKELHDINSSNVFDSIGLNIADSQQGNKLLNKILADTITSTNSFKHFVRQQSDTIENSLETANTYADILLGSDKDLSALAGVILQAKGSFVGRGVQGQLGIKSKVPVAMKDLFVQLGSIEENYVAFKEWFQNIYTNANNYAYSQTKAEITSMLEHRGSINVDEKFVKEFKNNKKEAEKSKASKEAKDEYNTFVLESYTKDPAKLLYVYRNGTAKEKSAIESHLRNQYLEKAIADSLKSPNAKRDVAYALKTDISAVATELQSMHIKNTMSALRLAYGDPNEQRISGNFAGLNPNTTIHRQQLKPFPKKYDHITDIDGKYLAMALETLGIDENAYNNIMSSVYEYSVRANKFLGKAIPTQLTMAYKSPTSNTQIVQQQIPVIDADPTISYGVSTNSQVELARMMNIMLMGHVVTPMEKRFLQQQPELDKLLIEAMPKSLVGIFNTQGMTKMSEVFPVLNHMEVIVQEKADGWKGQYNSNMAQIYIASQVQSGKDGEIVTTMTGKDMIETFVHEAMHASVAKGLTEAIHEYVDAKDKTTVSNDAKIIGELEKVIQNLLHTDASKLDAGMQKLQQIIKAEEKHLGKYKEEGISGQKRMLYVLIQELLSHATTTEGLGDLTQRTGIYSRNSAITKGLNTSVFGALWNLVASIFKNIFGGKKEPAIGEQLAVMDVVSASYAAFTRNGNPTHYSSNIGKRWLNSRVDPISQNVAAESVLERNRLENAVTSGTFFKNLQDDISNVHISNRSAEMVTKRAMEYFAVMDTSSFMDKLNTPEGQQYLQEADIRSIQSDSVKNNQIAVDAMIDEFPFAMSSSERFLFGSIYATAGKMLYKSPEAKAQLHTLYEHAKNILTPQALVKAGYTHAEAVDWVRALFENTMPLGKRFDRSNDIATNNMSKFVALVGSSARVMDMLSNVPAANNKSNSLTGNVGKVIDAVGNFNRATIQGKTLNAQVDATFDTLLAEFGSYQRRLTTDVDVSSGITPAGIFDNKVYPKLREKMRSALYPKLEEYRKKAETPEGLTAAEKLSFGVQTIAHSFLSPTVASSQEEEKITSVFRSLLNSTGKENQPMSWWKQYLSEIWGQHKGNEDLLAKVSIVKSTQDRARTMTVEQLPKLLDSKFNTPLDAENKAFLKDSFLDLDLGTLYKDMGKDAFIDALSNESVLIDKAYEALEHTASLLGYSSSQEIPHAIRSQIDGLAKFMHTHINTVNRLQLPNARQIARLASTAVKGNVDMDALTKAIDSCVSASAAYQLPLQDRAKIAKMFRNEPEGMEFFADYVNGLNKDTEEYSKSFNLSLKGGSYDITNPSRSLQTIRQADWEKYKEQGATIVKTSSMWDSKGRTEVPVFVVSTPIKQGVRSSGAARIIGDIVTSTFRDSQNAMPAFTDNTTESYQKLYENILSQPSVKPGKEYPILTLDAQGNMSPSLSVSKQERAKLLDAHKDAFESMGRWAGRIQESLGAHEHNVELMHVLHKAYQKDTIRHLSGEKGFIEISPTNPDPRVQEVYKLMPPEMREYGEKLFGGTIKVAKDNFTNAFGARLWTVSDIFRKPTEELNMTEKALKNVFKAMFGDNAARYAIKGGEYLEEWVGILKHSTVVLNLGVQAVNGIGNMAQLLAEGVNPIQIQKDYALGLQAAEEYRAVQAKILNIQSELRAELGKPESEQNIVKLTNLYQEEAVERTKLTSSVVHPLMEAGMFSTIAQDETTGMRYSNVMGDFNKALTKLTGKTSGMGRTALENLIGVKGSATGNFLHLANQYTDFLPKFSLYLHKTQRSQQRLTTKDALHYVRDSFVDYNYNPGAVRSVAEKMGGTWFVNYATRIVKSAGRLIRENPARALSLWGLTSTLGVPSLFDSSILAGHPLTNIDPTRVASTPTTLVGSIISQLIDANDQLGMIGK